MRITIYRACPVPKASAEAPFALPTGFPFLVDDDALVVQEPPLLYLSARFLKSAGLKRLSPHTLEAAAYDLADYWQAISDANIAWLDVNHDFLIDYCQARRGAISRQTQELLANSTVARRVSRALDFIRWQSAAGFPVDPELKRDVESRARLGQYLSQFDEAIFPSPVATTPACPSIEYVPSQLPKGDSVEVLTEHSWKLISNELGPLPSERGDSDPRSTRDRLAAELALQTGLRVDEVARLTIHQILELPVDETASPDTLIPMRVTRTKGLVQRTVYVPQYLVKELQDYIDSERVECCERSKDYRAKAAAGAPDKAPSLSRALFVNGINAGVHVGKDVSADTLSHQFHLAVLSAGLVRSAEKIDPDTGERFLTNVARHTYHHLRHTFAVWTYYSEKAAGNSAPWKVVQARLGHASLTTTITMYLKHTDDERKAVNSIVFNGIRERYRGC